LNALVFKEFGGPEVLELEDVPTPRAGAGEILIKVHSVSVNRTLDCIVRAGKYPVKIQLPHVLGADPAGEVVEAGDSATLFKPGDRVAVISATPCQKCGACLKGDEADCVDSKRIGVDRRLRGIYCVIGTLRGETSGRNLLCGGDCYHAPLSHGIQSSCR